MSEADTPKPVNGKKRASLITSANAREMQAKGAKKKRARTELLKALEAQLFDVDGPYSAAKMVESLMRDALEGDPTARKVFWDKLMPSSLMQQVADLADQGSSGGVVLAFAQPGHRDAMPDEQQDRIAVSVEEHRRKLEARRAQEARDVTPQKERKQ